MKKKLLQIKKEIGALSKKANNPFYKSKYLDLNDLLKAVEEVLANYNVLLMQPIIDNKVTTQLIDCDSEDDDKVESSMAIPPTDDVQKRGSAITYLRRYTLVSLLALQAIDDDGELAKKDDGKSTKEVKKKILELDTKDFDNCKNGFKNGYTMDQIRSKWYVSEEVEKELRS